MKRKDIITGVVALSVLVGSGYGIHNIAGKSIMGNDISPNVVYAEKNEEGVNKDLKDEAKSIIKDYFGKTPNFEQLEFSVETLTKEEQIAEIDEVINFRDNLPKDVEAAIKEFEKNLDFDEEKKKSIEEKRVRDLEKIKNNIKYGVSNINWESENERYRITFNADTKEMLTAQYDIKTDENKADKLISLEDAKKTAEEFLLNNNLGDIESLKLLKHEEFQIFNNDKVGGGFDFNAVAFFFEDEKDPDKKANVIVDRITGEVTEFAVGDAAQGVTYKTSPY